MGAQSVGRDVSPSVLWIFLVYLSMNHKVLEYGVFLTHINVNSSNQFDGIKGDISLDTTKQLDMIIGVSEIRVYPGKRHMMAHDGT